MLNKTIIGILMISVLVASAGTVFAGWQENTGNGIGQETCLNELSEQCTDEEDEDDSDVRSSETQPISKESEIPSDVSDKDELETEEIDDLDTDEVENEEENEEEVGSITNILEGEIDWTWNRSD